MRSFIDEVTDQLNLRWAWEKVRRLATPGDIWFDEVELAGFELDLQRNLESVRAALSNGRYALKPLRPLPFPKRGDQEGALKLRQGAFCVSIRDQVAWVAVVNVVGPHVDSKMPPWSYGNRLYRSIWVEKDEDGIERRKIGRYRHAAGRLYLPFGQSWPIFRRHVYLATRAMASADGLPEPDERTRKELEFEERLVEEHRCPFVMPEYWLSRRRADQVDKLYWCGLDLERFYPRLRLDVARDNILEHLPPPWRNAAGVLLDSMLSFPLERSEWAVEDLKAMGVRSRGKVFRGVPVGLYVAGFLANAALLRVDLKVAELLKNKGIAHFRFVDDHVVLAYEFAELSDWVQTYEELLRDSGTNARFNLKKLKPIELGRVLRLGRANRGSMPHGGAVDSAKSACRLDPKFPSPLMTKTLALVSAIGRTNFALCEAHELEALTDQLEHLLLVDLPDEEIQEQTRIAFAATRLARIVECRLATHPAGESAEHERQVQRVFQLVRKALREQPDRVRLWTCAARMCRLTGAGPLEDLHDDIRATGGKNSLAAEYLHANMLCVLASQALEAARLLRGESVAEWRKQAAHAFLEDLSEAPFEAPDGPEVRRYARMSWSLYCFALYCSDLVLKESSWSGATSPGIRLPEKLVGFGKQYAERGGFGYSAAQWAWWAARTTLRDLEPHANGLVKALGEALEPSSDTNAFWRYFPLDVPGPALLAMTARQAGAADGSPESGWWYDALRTPQGIDAASFPRRRGSRPVRVLRLLEADHLASISLHEWCDHLVRLSREASKRGTTDPRTGEWTALEIVRQIAEWVARLPNVAPYLRSRGRAAAGVFCVHPANFRVPRQWVEEPEPSWVKWQQLVRKDGGRSIIPVPKRQQILDDRFSPLGGKHPLFREIDPVRGLGLLLYGLLRRSFDLPTAWNGTGHASVLPMLPRLLLADMTCSSWTLGVLQGCLFPRATENLFLKRESWAPSAPNDDTLRDPVEFLDALQVERALRRCQEELVEHQLSTLRERARQLTPVSVRQLTEPQWAKVFGVSTTADDDIHD